MRLFRSMVLGIGVLWFGSMSAMGRAAVPDKEVKPAAPKKSALDKNGKINGKTIKEWIQQLEEKDAMSRYHAAEALAKAGSEAEEALPTLEKMKLDGDEYNRKLAEYTVVYVHPPATEQSGAALLGVLKDKNHSDAERRLAAYRLANLGDEATPFFDDLVGLLASEDADVRLLAAYVLPYLRPTTRQGLTGATPVDAATPLVPALKDKNKEVARTAAASLVVMGKKARSVVPTVLPLLNDQDPYRRALAAYVLGNVKPYPEDVVDPIRKVLNDPNESVRKAARDALKKIDKAEAKRAGIE